MFIEVKIGGLNRLYAVDSIQCVQNIEDNAVLFFKDNPDVGLITSTMYQSVRLSILRSDPLERSSKK